MAQLFQESGDTSNVESASPTLWGEFVAGIDNPMQTDGLGLVTPWGSGATARAYLEYGINVPQSPDDTLLQSLGAASGSGALFTYSVNGVVGPQGEMGPQGPPGITTIQTILYPVTSGDLGSVLKQLEAWNAAEDTIPYGATSHIEWEERWVKMDVAAIRTWNDAAVDEDGSFMLIASDSGIHVSTDSGVTWALKTPTDEDFLFVDVSDASGNAVALGDTGKSNGELWVSSNYGANWTKVTIDAV
jgi:hypothetical protein